MGVSIILLRFATKMPESKLSPEAREEKIKEFDESTIIASNPRFFYSSVIVLGGTFVFFVLSEFLHIMVNNLRAKEAYTLILSVEEQSSEEITNMLGLVCDEMLVISESGSVNTNGRKYHRHKNS